MKKIIYISLIGLSTACGTKSAEISSKPQQEPKVVEQEKIDSRPMAAFPNAMTYLKSLGIQKKNGKKLFHPWQEKQNLTIYRRVKSWPM
jgi:hypothetical protein